MEKQKIKAIETEYNGYRFRSRLEARWAVFFDAIGIDYQYEQEGFEFESMYGEKYNYLPDFYFQTEDCYAEVKGTDDQLMKDAAKIAYSIDWDSTPCSNGLLILGEIPNYTKMKWGNIPMFSYLYCNKSVERTYAAFWGTGYLIKNTNVIMNTLYKFSDNDYTDSSNERLPDKTSTKCCWSYDDLRSIACSGNKSFTILQNAYKIARQVRFEHGETPTAKQVYEMAHSGGAFNAD